MSTKTIACLALLILGETAGFGVDLVVDGTSRLITTDTEVTGSVYVQNGGLLTLRNATLTLVLDHDEQHHIDISDTSRMVVDDGMITSTGGQYWIELSGDPGQHPTLEVKGDESWITNHSGIRPFDDARVLVTGGDVEELQVRDRVQVTLSDAATYPVFFFDGVTAVLAGLDTGTSVDNTISIPGAWSFSLQNAWIEGYQIDLMNGASVNLSSGDGIVASIHTPGDLGDELRIVEGVTSDEPISGSITNLGSSFVFTDSNIALLNVYVQGSDRVLLRDLHVNEVNAEGVSELVVGQKGYATPLNCNLCQVYDRAAFTVVEATIDPSDNLPSATAAFGSADPVGRGTMAFVNMDLRDLDLTAIEEGTLSLRDCEVDPARITVIDATATVEESSLVADFTPDRLSGTAPLTVTFLDHAAGDIDSWAWNFGDGATSTLAAPIHTYTGPGTYTVTLAVASGQNTDSKIRQNLVEVTGGGGGGEPCQADAETLCIDGGAPGDGRFQIEVDFDTALGGGRSGAGQAVSLGSLGVDKGGLFWFFNQANPEMLIKILDGCAVNGKFWVFYSAGTNVGLDIRVTDTTTGTVWADVNPDGRQAPPVADTAAFACN